jgi:hypothetical protein
MSPASLRAIFRSVVQHGGGGIRQLVRVVAAFLSKLCFAVLRAIISGVVVSICVMVMLHFLGVPVPGPSELLDKFEALGRLATILS